MLLEVNNDQLRVSVGKLKQSGRAKYTAKSSEEAVGEDELAGRRTLVSLEGLCS